jgi:hypothetical protein
MNMDAQGEHFTADAPIPDATLPDIDALNEDFFNQDLDITPPDITDFLAKTGLLSPLIPKTARIYAAFFHRNGTLKNTFVHENGSPNLRFMDDKGDIFPEFLDAFGRFIPLINRDGTPILEDDDMMSTKSSASSGSDFSAAARIAEVVKSQTKALEDMSRAQSHITTKLWIWDGNPKTWYAWKDDFTTKLSTMGIKDATDKNMSADDSTKVYNLIHESTKRGNTEYGRKIRLMLRTGRLMDSPGYETWKDLLNFMKRIL